jgi:hypothetical protein
MVREVSSRYGEQRIAQMCDFLLVQMSELRGLPDGSGVNVQKLRTRSSGIWVNQALPTPPAHPSQRFHELDEASEN